MSYLSLPLQYRPWTLDQVKGQDHVTDGLEYAITNDRVRQAYLFSGIRGTGKTTMARVLAAALNCLEADGPTVKPCLKCQSCKAVRQGDDVSVFEIDGASNNKVEDVRKLKDQIGTFGMHGRFKIYIIDEIQMFTKQAFNALLKTLEEPPKHVKFILCTTELAKIPKTIQSRCQLYPFRPIREEVLSKHLSWVLDQEKVTYDEEFILELVKMAHGSLRDGITTLDQLINSGQNPLTAATLENFYGKPQRSQVQDILVAISRGDVPGTMSGLNRLTRKGFSEYYIVTTLIDALQELIPKRLSDPEKLGPVVDIIMELEMMSRNVRASETPQALLEATLLRIALNRHSKNNQ